MSLIAQSTVYPRLFCLGATGLSPIVTISKAGAAFGAAAGAVSEIGSTWYKALLTVIDTETLGDLGYHITAAGADDLDMCDQVVAAPVGALTSGERNAVADAQLDRADGIETGLTPRQLGRVAYAASAGKLSGAATTTVKVRNKADAKDRITATVDADGNRTAVTLDLT